MRQYLYHDPTDEDMMSVGVGILSEKGNGCTVDQMLLPVA